MPALANECIEMKDDCQYYLCVEAKKSCGDRGYLKAFGHKYCQDFKAVSSSMYSPRAMQWFGEVRSCLIRKITEMDKNLTCNELKNQAFKSHLPCYLETNFCDLRLLDKLNIVAVLKNELQNPAIIKLGLKIMHSCSLLKSY